MRDPSGVYTTVYDLLDRTTTAKLPAAKMITYTYERARTAEDDDEPGRRAVQLRL